jgi:hypothetical protein
MSSASFLRPGLSEVKPFLSSALKKCPEIQAHRRCGRGVRAKRPATGECFEFLQPAGWAFIFRLEPLSDFWNSLVPAKLKRTVFCTDADGLAFSDFAFEDVDAERIENFFLNSAAKRACTQTRVVPFAREEFLR